VTLKNEKPAGATMMICRIFEGRKIGPDLPIEPLQKHSCFFDVYPV